MHVQPDKSEGEQFIVLISTFAADSKKAAFLQLTSFFILQVMKAFTETVCKIASINLMCLMRREFWRKYKGY